MFDIEAVTTEYILPWLIKAVLALVIFIVGRWVAKGITAVVSRLMKRHGLDDLLVRTTCSIVYIALLGFVVLAALSQLGVDTTSALAVFGAAGLAVGLAMKDSLSNFASGIMLAVFRPFNLDHFVELAGVSGTVQDVGLFSTTLLTPDNRRIIVPNGMVYGSTIVNYSAEPLRRIDLVFGIGYDDDLATASGLISEVIGADRRIVADPAPVVMALDLADSSVNIAARPWVNNKDYWAVRADLLEKVKRAFDDNGISIPYPQRDVHLHQVEPEAA